MWKRKKKLREKLSLITKVGFMGTQSLVLKKALFFISCSAIAVLKFLGISGQGAPYFHFTLSSANFVNIPANFCHISEPWVDPFFRVPLYICLVPKAFCLWTLEFCGITKARQHMEWLGGTISKTLTLSKIWKMLTAGVLTSSPGSS